jgi:hypothetical protein
MSFDPRSHIVTDSAIPVSLGLCIVLVVFFYGLAAIVIVAGLAAGVFARSINNEPPRSMSTPHLAVPFLAPSMVLMRKNQIASRGFMDIDEQIALMKLNRPDSSMR